MPDWSTPLPSDQDSSGRSFGHEELELLRQVIESGCLFAPKGQFTKSLEADFATWLGANQAVGCSSGTAAVHSAVAAIDPEPGAEIITTPITDIGAITPIVYQGAIPVFADVDSDTGNISAESVSARVSERTCAVVVTHLFGNVADIDGIVRLASEHGLPVIEDCAQAFGATSGEKKVGTFGHVATFSLQQGKHISAGEGGLVAAASEEVARRVRLFVNKAWDYDDPSDHEFLALNYRMSELQAAVASAQLARLDGFVHRRRQNALFLDEAIEHMEGVYAVPQPEQSHSSYWRYAILVDPDGVPGGPDALASKLRELGIPSAPRYVKQPAFQTSLFRNHRTFGSSRWPFTVAREEALDYSPERFPGTFEFLRRVLVLPWNERFDEGHLTRIAESLEAALVAVRRDAA